jgi:hypothetical protein
MKSFVFWLMKWKMHQIKNKWLLFWDLLIFRVFYERVLFSIVHVSDTTSSTLKKRNFWCAR